MIFGKLNELFIAEPYAGYCNSSDVIPGGGHIGHVREVLIVIFSSPKLKLGEDLLSVPTMSIFDAEITKAADENRKFQAFFFISKKLAMKVSRQ